MALTKTKRRAVWFAVFFCRPTSPALFVIAVVQVPMPVVYFVNQLVRGKSHRDSQDADDHKGNHDFQSPSGDASYIVLLNCSTSRHKFKPWSPGPAPSRP